MEPPVTGWRAKAVPLALLLLCGCASVQAPAPAPTDAPAIAVPAPTGNPTEIGPTANSENIHFSVSLRLPPGRDLDAYMAGLTDPRSPYFRRYLTPAEFGERFGVSQQSVNRVVRWLTDAGL